MTELIVLPVVFIGFLIVVLGATSIEKTMREQDREIAKKQAELDWKYFERERREELKKLKGVFPYGPLCEDLKEKRRS